MTVSGTLTVGQLVVGDAGAGRMVVADGGGILVSDAAASDGDLLVGGASGTGVVSLDGASILDLAASPPKGGLYVGGTRSGVGGVGELVLGPQASILASSVTLWPTGQLAASGGIGANGAGVMPVHVFGTLVIGDPAAPGTVTLDLGAGSSLDMTPASGPATGSLVFDVQDAVNSDRLVVDGTAEIDGTLVISSLGDLGDGEAVVIEAGVITGQFDALAAPATPSGEVVRIVPSAGPSGQIRIALGAAAPIGDLDDPVPGFTPGDPVDADTDEIESGLLLGMQPSPDLVVLQEDTDGNDSVVLLENLGQGVDGWMGYGMPMLIAALTPGEVHTTVRLAELDLTPGPDIVVLNRTAAQVIVFRNVENTPGQFEPAASYDLAVGVTDPRNFDVDDINGDGHDDLVITALENTGGVVATLLNGMNKDGTWAGLSPGPSSPAGLDPGDIRLNDLSLDRNAEAIVIDGTARRLRVLRGVGDGNFTTGAELPTGEAPRIASASSNKLLVNIDEDKWDDIPVLHTGGDGLAGGFDVNVTGPDLEFQIQIPVPTEPNRTALAVADLDGDGDPDFIVGGPNTSSEERLGPPLPGLLQIIRNDTSTGGTIQFTEVAAIPVDQTIRFLLPDDVDGDGIDDILAFGDPPSSASEEHVQIFAAVEPCAGDLTNDGVVDLSDLNVVLEDFGDLYSIEDLNGVLASWGVLCP